MLRLLGPLDVQLEASPSRYRRLLVVRSLYKSQGGVEDGTREEGGKGVSEGLDKSWLDIETLCRKRA